MNISLAKTEGKKYRTRNYEGVANMVEKENPEIISSHGHTKITATYRAIIYENDLETTRKDFPQLKT